MALRVRKELDDRETRILEAADAYRFAQVAVENCDVSRSFPPRPELAQKLKRRIETSAERAKERLLSVALELPRK